MILRKLVHDFRAVLYLGFPTIHVIYFLTVLCSFTFHSLNFKTITRKTVHVVFFLSRVNPLPWAPPPPRKMNRTPTFLSVSAVKLWITPPPPRLPALPPRCQPANRKAAIFHICQKCMRSSPAIGSTQQPIRRQKYDGTGGGGEGGGGHTL